MRITVLGAGAWERPSPNSSGERQCRDALDLKSSTLEEIQRGRNEHYLPGVALPVDWKTEPDFKKAIGGAEGILLAIPSQAFREVAAKLKGHPAIFISVTKGIELRLATP